LYVNYDSVIHEGQKEYENSVVRPHRFLACDDPGALRSNHVREQSESTWLLFRLPRQLPVPAVDGIDLVVREVA
jgi:hypothetical protein